MNTNGKKHLPKEIEDQVQTKHLLIMDDDKEFCDYLQSLAQTINYEVLTLSDPTKFQSIYQDFKPDVIILDLEIPNIDGIELLRLLKTDGCICPVVIISGLEEEIILSAHRVGRLHGLNMLTAFKKPIQGQAITTLLHKIEKMPRLTSDQLEATITENKFALHFEPKICLNTQQIVGIEALVRMEKNTEEALAPENFIRLAEDNGHIKKFTLLMFEKMLKSFLKIKKNQPLLVISIKLSSKLLNDLRLPDELELLTQSYKIDPANICLGVTESAAMTQPLQAIDILTRFRMKKFKLAVDDFGTGFSSLAVLHRMPFNELKIDKSFVKNLTDDKELVTLVKDMIMLGKSCEYEITAKGVDDAETLKMLKTLKCDAAQGYFISSPMPPLALQDWCNDKHNQAWRNII